MSKASENQFGLLGRFPSCCCNTTPPLCSFSNSEKHVLGSLWPTKGALNFLLWKETRQHMLMPTYAYVGHVVKISSATWEYSPKRFTLSLLTYVCSFIRTLLYPLAGSLLLWRIVSLWAAVSSVLYNAVTLPLLGLLSQRQKSQDWHWCGCSQALQFFCSAEEWGYLNCALLLATLQAVIDVAHLLQVGDIVSVIDMPPKELTTWWRGKHGFQVGTSIRHDSAT